MSWQLVARKDFEDAVRSRMIWAVVGVFLLLMVIIVLGAASGSLEDADATNVFMLFVNIGGQLLVPIVGLVVGYMAIVGERESGSLRVLFGLSHGRRDVFFGKLASRLGVIAVATLVACAAAAVMSLVLFGSLPLVTFLQFVALTLSMGMAFTAIAVSVSAIADSRMGAMGGAIGSYILFTMLWHPIVAGVHYLVEGELVGLEGPGWYFFLQRLNPFEAYVGSMSLVLDQYIWGVIGWVNIVEDVSPEQTQQEGALLVTNRVAGDAPVYLSEWFGGVVLLAWIVVPVVLGYWRFERADLN